MPSGAALVPIAHGSLSVQTGIGVAKGTRNPQSLVFSRLSGDLYVMQVDESNGSVAGNLTLIHYTKDTNSHWQVHTSMDLNRFGHGVTFGFWQDSGGTPWWWSECNADSAGRGTAIDYFSYAGGQYIDDNPGYPIQPVPASNYTCTIDPTNTYLALRYQVGSAHYYQAFAVYDLVYQDFSKPLISLDSNGHGLAEYPDDSSPYTFQGWTVAGHYLYTLFEDKRTSSSTYKTGFLRSYDLNRTENNSNGFIAFASHGASSKTPGEYEGLTAVVTSGTATLFYMITASTNPYTFDLRSIT